MRKNKEICYFFNIEVNFYLKLETFCQKSCQTDFDSDRGNWRFYFLNFLASFIRGNRARWCLSSQIGHFILNFPGTQLYKLGMFRVIFSNFVRFELIISSNVFKRFF
jgi:hypothetical protein